MPIYVYACDACGHNVDEFQHMSDTSLTECPECGSDTYHRVPCRTHSDMVEYDKPIELYSVALNDDQEINDFQRQCPDVEVSRDPKDPMYGVPIARTRKQKLDSLEVFDFEEKN